MAKTLDINFQITTGSKAKPTCKVFVDGEQIGFISSLHIDMTKDNVYPDVTLDFTQGIDLSQYPETKKHLLEVYEALKGFPIKATGLDKL